MPLVYLLADLGFSTYLLQTDELEHLTDAGGRDAVARGEPAHDVRRVGGEKIVARRREIDEPLLERIGNVPLPPYIHRQDTPEDRERYQTVYAREPGSVAVIEMVGKSTAGRADTASRR